MEEVKTENERTLAKTEPKAKPKAKPNNNSMVMASALNTLDIYNPDDRSKLELYLKSVMSSDKCGIKTIQDGLAIYSRAKELGLPFTSCIEHLGVINGKTTLDIHLIKALLLKAAITWECTKDYIALYEYTDGNNVYIDSKIPDYCRRFKSKREADEFNASVDNDEIGIYPVRNYQDYNGTIYKEYQLNNKFGVAANQQQAKDIAAKGLVPIFRIPNVPCDYITEYKLTRIVYNRVITSIGHFSYSDAVTAGLASKDTYTKYMRVLIGHRAFTLAARDIAADVILGCMETTEAKIANNMSIDDADIVEI